MNKLKAGVIGVGSMGENHVRVYSELENTLLQSAADVNEETLRKTNQKYNISAYKDYGEMLSKEKLDIVSIVVPNSLHKQVAFDVISLGIPTLLEKPLALTVKEGEEIVDYAEKKKVKLMVGYLERFNPAVIELKKRLDDSELGRVYSIDVRRIGPSSTRKRDSGVLFNIGIHDLDIIQYLLNSEPVSMHSESTKGIYSEHKDMFYGLLRFPNRVIASLSINWVSPAKVRQLCVTGEKGMFVVDYLTQDLFFYENANNKSVNHEKEQKQTASQEFLSVLKGASEGNMIKYHINRKEPLRAEIEHFVDCVAKNKKPLIDGREALKSLRLAERLIKAEG